MPKSLLASTLDELQRRLDPLLRNAAFRKHGRTYNRITADGLTQVIGFQMGPSDPPGATHIPGLRENLYGLFAVNLGVYVPEVARNHGGGEAKPFVHDYDCCIRTRLGRAASKEIWWKISADAPLADELERRLNDDAFPFFQRFEQRDQILSEFRSETDNTELMAAPRIVCAIILLNRGESQEARRLLSAQAHDRRSNPRHRAYVIEFAQHLGIEFTP
jgi:hypothetical protein